LPGGGWPDLGGRIWYLGFIVAALVLLWSEPTVVMAITASLWNNLKVVCDPSVAHAQVWTLYVTSTSWLASC
jgi:hypothetical protein